MEDTTPTSDVDDDPDGDTAIADTDTDTDDDAAPAATDAALTNLLHAQMPFTAELGMEVVRGGADAVIATAAWAPERCTAGGMMHGGYLMALADSVGAACAVFNLPEGSGGTTTVESSTRFLRAVREGEITVTSTALHVGRTTIVIQTDITRVDGALVSRTLQTQAILPKP
jgi:1,4-dihydroxy-2-naphthoyl-CoA hydrolase